MLLTLFFSVSCCACGRSWCFGWLWVPGSGLDGWLLFPLQHDNSA